jgi:hypothetical protein
MTKLCEMIMECRAIGIDDRVILYGWASQLEEGNETVCASKQTVADFLGVSLNTVKRHTKTLVKAGWMLATGERNQWEPDCWTPVFAINVEKIAEGQVIMIGGSNWAAAQIAPQGTYALSGVRSFGLSGVPSVSYAATTATGVPPAAGGSRSKELGRPVEPVEPKPKPKPSPTPQAQKKVKLCPKCNEPWSRFKNHVCSSMADSSMAQDSKERDEYIVGSTWRPDPKFKDDHRGLEARQLMEETAEQKTEESLMEEGRTTATATPFAQSPGSADPPQAGKRCAGCGGREPCRDKWCYAYEPLPKSEEIIRPTGINP